MSSEEYALYQGEELVMIGTKKELAEHLKVDEETIYFYTTPTYLRRIKGSAKRRVVVKLEDDEE